MRDVLSKIGEGMEKPEAAWGVLNGHGGTRAFLAITGLFAFSRLVTVILDVHRWSAVDLATTPVDLGFLLGTFERGSLWYSFIIGTYGVLIVLLPCAMLSLFLAPAGTGSRNGTGMDAGTGDGAKKRIFLESLSATTFRLPIVFGVTLIALFLLGDVLIVEYPAPLVVWICGFGLGVFEIWRVSGKIAACHGHRPRDGILVVFITSVIVTIVAVGMTALIGGFD
jgi:hypothetical protein